MKDLEFSLQTLEESLKDFEERCGEEVMVI